MKTFFLKNIYKLNFYIAQISQGQPQPLDFNYMETWLTHRRTNCRFIIVIKKNLKKMAHEFYEF